MRKYFAAMLLVTMSINANAAIVTHNYLSSDDSTNIIVDGLNNVEYLRLDVLADSTYAETLAVLGTQDGGGWSIATPTDALNFMSALLGGSGSNSCTHDGTAPTNSNCGTATGWMDGDFGANNQGSIDLAWFLDDGGEADYIFLRDGDGLAQLLNYSTIIDTDMFSAGGSQSAYPVSWLVVRSTVVPVPAAVWLFGSALAGLGWMRLKQIT